MWDFRVLGIKLFKCIGRFRWGWVEWLMEDYGRRNKVSVCEINYTKFIDIKRIIKSLG